MEQLWNGRLKLHLQYFCWRNQILSFGVKRRDLSTRQDMLSLSMIWIFELKQISDQRFDYRRTRRAGNNRILEIEIIAARRTSWVIVIVKWGMQEDGLLYAISKGGAV